MASEQDINIFSRQMMSEGGQFGETIGKGPLGTTYRIIHPTYGNCALKYFNSSVAKHKKFLKNFFRPLAKLLQLEHPNLAKIHELGTQDHVFIIRELVVGASLQEQFSTKKKFSLAEATQILLDATMAVLAGYPAKVTYKNIKPSNIILLTNGTARLVDVSLPPSDSNYIAPEQWSKKRSDTRSDIYALGVIYYKMLCGVDLFSGATQADIQDQHLNATPDWEVSGEIPGQILEILKTMLAKSPQDRYPSPLSLIIALRKALQSMGIEPKSAPELKPQGKTIAIAPEKTNEVKDDDHRQFTTMLVAANIEKSSKKTAEVSAPEASEEATRIVSRQEYLSHPQQVAGDQDIDEVYISRHSIEETPDKALTRVSYIEERRERTTPLPLRVVYFPKGFEQTIVEHLQQKFRRETWLLKESEIPGQMEIEINLEKAYELIHFYHYEDQLQEALEKYEQALQKAIQQESQSEKVFAARKSAERDGHMETMDLREDEVICLADGDEEAQELESAEDYSVETINDITINTISSRGKVAKSCERDKYPENFHYPDLEVIVDYQHAYQAAGWCKFVIEHKLKKGEHFDVLEGDENGSQRIVIHLKMLGSYQQEQEHIERIKEFFHADYEITELDRGGMGAVLKLTAREDPTILFLRPENYWARKRYAEHLRVINARGKEGVYAEFPKGTEFVVKVAFEGYEESLIREAMILSKVAEDPNVCQTIIGSVQQGRLFASDENDQTRIGYYLMLEYAPHGNCEQLYKRFPERKLAPTVGFAIMYGMVQTLQKLKHQGIIHRDIKPQNILLDKNGIPKLSDFGLAITTTEMSGKLTEDRRRLLRVMDEDFLHISRTREQAEDNLHKLMEKQGQLATNEPEHQNMQQEIEKLRQEIPLLIKQEEERAKALKEKYRPISAEENAMHGKFAGSLHYAAPEQFCLDAVLTPKCDIYQLGASMFTLLTGKKPVEGRTIVEIMSQLLYPVKIQVSDIIKDNLLVDTMSKIIHKVMQHNPKDRIDIDEVRKQLDNICEEYQEQLKTEPVYEKPADLTSAKQEERWNRRIAFAKELHSKCVDMIFNNLRNEKNIAEQSEVKQNTLKKEMTSKNDKEKIVFHCPGCGKRLHVYRAMDGKKGNCPGCKKRILVQLGL